MRYAAALVVITLGAILAFGVRATPESVDIQVIGVVLILTGLAGVATAYWLSVTPRRTDVIYHGNRVTLLEPSSPSPGGSTEPVDHQIERIEEQVDSLPPDGAALPPAPGLVPGAHVVTEPQSDDGNRIEGVMDAEPGSEEFLRMQREWE
ncbi:MAG TPA: hypothetical protein VGL21_04870 [Jatrophihabitantaceae bacterium]